MPAEPSGNLAQSARRSRADTTPNHFFNPVTFDPMAEALSSE